MPPILLTKVCLSDHHINLLPGDTVALFYLLRNLLDPEFVYKQVSCRCRSSACKNANILFIRSTNPLDNLSGLLSCMNGLLTSSTLQTVCVGIQGHYLVDDVILNEAQRLTRGRVVTVEQWTRTVDCLDGGVVMGDDQFFGPDNAADGCAFWQADFFNRAATSAC